MEETVTSDMSKFGSRERKLAEELLREWRLQGLPEDFYDDKVTIAMNLNSGFVFLTNEEYQVAMMHNGKLESFYSCFECGEEGFREELECGHMFPESEVA